jgi:HNH endonuclease
MRGVMVKTETGWEREHRVVTDAPSRSRHEQWLIVHHLDGDPTNNDPDNLETMTQAEHARLHDPERERDSKGRYA